MIMDKRKPSEHLEEAKKLIDEYLDGEFSTCISEEESETGIIPVAYTTLGDDEEYEVQATIDLNKNTLKIEITGEHDYVEEVTEITMEDLVWLDFSDLTYIDNWEDKRVPWKVSD